MVLTLTNKDAVFGRGRKKNDVRQGSIYRALIEHHWLPYSKIHHTNQTKRRAYVQTRIIKKVIKRGGRFIIREGEYLRLLKPQNNADFREIHKKIQRALFNEKKRREMLGNKDDGHQSDFDSEFEPSKVRSFFERKVLCKHKKGESDQFSSGEEECLDGEDDDLTMEQESTTSHEDRFGTIKDQPSPRLDGLAKLATSLLKSGNGQEVDGGSYSFNRAVVDQIKLKPRMLMFEDYLDDFGSTVCSQSGPAFSSFVAL